MAKSQLSAEFQSAYRYAKQIPNMKPRNRKEGVRRLFAKIKVALANKI